MNPIRIFKNFCAVFRDSLRTLDARHEALQSQVTSMAQGIRELVAKNDELETQRDIVLNNLAEVDYQFSEFVEYIERHASKLGILKEAGVNPATDLQPYYPPEISRAIAFRGLLKRLSQTPFTKITDLEKRGLQAGYVEVVDGKPEFKAGFSRAIPEPALVVTDEQKADLHATAAAAFADPRAPLEAIQVTAEGRVVDKRYTDPEVDRAFVQKVAEIQENQEHGHGHELPHAPQNS